MHNLDPKDSSRPVAKPKLSLAQIEMADVRHQARQLAFAGRLSAREAAILVLRGLLGLVLLATGVGKLLDVPGFEGVIRSYQLLSPWMVKPVAVGMVLTELKLAESFLGGRNLRAAALFSTGLHVAFIGWAVIALLRGLKLANCGCFGVFLARPLTWGTPLEDLVMVAISWGLFAAVRRR